MESLDLLWELQKHDNTLRDIKNKLRCIANNEKVDLIASKLNETESKLNDLESRLEENEKRLIKNNSILKDLDFKLKELEKDLYKGTIGDLTQLSYLDKERELVNKEIEEKELEILLQMEDMENLKKEFLKIEKDFKNLRIQYTKLIKEYKVSAKELREKEIEEKSQIDMISSKIDKDTLNMYMQLKNSRGSAVVEVVDNKCSGCNMVLPTFVTDKLKNHKVIIHCENCDRILYPEK